MAEGSMRENLDKAAYYRPSNLTAIIDVNRLGQRGPTKLEADMAAYQRRAGASRSSTVIIDCSTAVRNSAMMTGKTTKPTRLRIWTSA